MYAELHCHSAFSFLDGASPPDELLAEAHRLGYPALALTDRNGVYGALEFATAAKPLDIQAITGAEVTLTDGSHVVLLAESPAGYANLCRLLTAAEVTLTDGSHVVLLAESPAGYANLGRLLTAAHLDVGAIRQR